MANFNNQWIEIFRAGKPVDSAGVTRAIEPEFLDSVIANFNASEHEPPLVAGHPAENAPAFGWVSELRRSGDLLEARFKDVDEDFAELVRSGKFKKRSAAFYLGAGGNLPALRHVGFLGAQPPAVKGLRDIQFSEGDALTFDFNEGDSSMTLTGEQETSLVERVTNSITTKFAAAFGGNKAETHHANFSESDVQRIVNEAITKTKTEITSDFSEKLTTVQNENKQLREAVNASSGAQTRAAIIQFCDGLGNDKLPPALRNLGIVDFMESLASDDTKVTVVSFSENADGAKVETKTETTQFAWFKNFLTALAPVISFGEQFGALTATGNDAVITNPTRMAELRAKDGLSAKTGGGK